MGFSSRRQVSPRPARDFVCQPDGQVLTKSPSGHRHPIRFRRNRTTNFRCINEKMDHSVNSPHAGSVFLLTDAVMHRWRASEERTRCGGFAPYGRTKRTLIVTRSLPSLATSWTIPSATFAAGCSVSRMFTLTIFSKSDTFAPSSNSAVSCSGQVVA